MERITYEDPGSDDLTVLHVSRYCFASQFVLSNKVLDIGCGEGFGSSLLSRGAKSVVGCDVSAKAISSSKLKYGKGKAAFLVCDGTKLPFEDASFDVVVAFEVIEHLKNPSALLKVIRRMLHEEGVLVISTPKRIVPFLRLNPFHIREFNFEEFVILLSNSFGSVEIVGQEVLNLQWKITHRLAPFLPVTVRKVLRRLYSKSKKTPGEQIISSFDCLDSNVAFITGKRAKKAEYYIAICKKPKL
jgi:2-polyprenyl-3-methyl-5-hydroxy-6-metoxy-1,4-benzoquinol methylase